MKRKAAKPKHCHECEQWKHLLRLLELTVTIQELHIKEMTDMVIKPLLEARKKAS